MDVSHICEEQEIKEIVSAIKKAFNDSFRMNSSTIEIIHNHLGKLQDYLTNLANTEDLSLVVTDFIEITSNLLGLSDNHLQIKLTLKSNIARLEEAFSDLASKNSDYYRQLLFVPGLALCHSDQEN